MIVSLFFLFLITTILLSYKKFKLGYFFFVFCYFTYPRAFSLGLGGQGFALTMQRAQLLLLFVIALLKIYNFKKYRIVFYENVKAIRFFYYIVIVYYFFKVFSSIYITNLNTEVFSGLLDDFQYSIVLIFITLLAISDLDDLFKLIKIFAFVIIINTVFGIVEIGLGHTLFKNVQLMYVEASGRDITAVRFQGGAQRIQALFENYLALAYSSFLIFLLLYSFKSSWRLSHRYLYIIAILCCIFCAYYARSRAALGLLVFFYLIIAVQTYVFKVRGKFYLNIGVLALIYLTGGIILIIGFNSIFSFLHSLETGQQVSIGEDVSANERLLQLASLFKTDGPEFYFGFGRLRYMPDVVPDEIINKQDNFFIRIFLESGIIGMLLYFFFILSTIKYAFKNFVLTKIAKSRYLQKFHFGIFLYTIALFIILNISSSIFYQFFVLLTPIFLYILRKETLQSNTQLTTDESFTG